MRRKRWSAAIPKKCKAEETSSYLKNCLPMSCACITGRSPTIGVSAISCLSCSRSADGLRQTRVDHLPTQTVKIVRFHEIGAPEVLQLDELPLPEPGIG